MTKKRDFPTPAEMIEEMRQSLLSGMGEQGRVGEPPLEGQDKFEHERKMLDLIDSGGVRFQCVGCGEVLTVDEAHGCACGSFTCDECVVPDDETCTHTPHEVFGIPKEDDEDHG